MPVLAFAPPSYISIHHVSTSGTALPWDSFLLRVSHQSFELQRANTICNRIVMSLFAMWDYNRLNSKKEAQCLAEKITDDRGCEFKDMGDASPLFR